MLRMERRLTFLLYFSVMLGLGWYTWTIQYCLLDEHCTCQILRMCYFRSRYAWCFCLHIWTFLLLTSVLFCNRRRPCAFFGMMFMNWKWETYSCPKGILLGCSNTLPVVVIILVELLTNFLASEIFLWRSNMLTCLLSRPTVNSKVMEVMYVLFLNVISTPCSIFLMCGVSSLEGLFSRWWWYPSLLDCWLVRSLSKWC